MIYNLTLRTALKFTDLKPHLMQRQAISCYQQVIKFQPQNFYPHLKLGIICKNQGEIQEAIYHFQEVIRLQPNHGAAYFQLSLLYRKAGNFNKAFLAGQRALFGTEIDD